MDHSYKPRVDALMFEVTLRTVSNVCMKRCRLALQECLIVHMATDAFAVISAFICRVTCGAVLGHGGVRG